MECATCGLAPCDLPDGVDPEFVFERCDDGEIRCQADAARASWSLDFHAFPAPTEETDHER